MIDSSKLIDLAARGIPQVHIARALGVSESRLSQLLSDERVKELVTAKESEIASEELDAIKSLATINSNLLSHIDSLVEGTDSLGEAVAAYEKLTRLQAQKQGGSVESEDGIRNITIQMPIFLQQNVAINTSPRNEIIDINERAMTTMPTVAVHRLIKTHAKSKATSRNPLQGIDPATIEF